MNTVDGKPFMSDPPILRVRPTDSTDHSWTRVAIWEELEINPPTEAAKELRDVYLEIRGVDYNTVEIKLAGKTFLVSGVTLSNLIGNKMRKIP